MATAVMLVGACSDDDGLRTLAQGDDIEFTGSGELGDQTMDVRAHEEDGEVTGEVSFEPHGSVISFQCADTEVDGLIVLAGQLTTTPADGDLAVGTWMALIIHDGHPDSAAVWFADPGTESCDEALEHVPDDPPLYEVEDGHDIETG